MDGLECVLVALYTSISSNKDRWIEEPSRNSTPMQRKGIDAYSREIESCLFVRPQCRNFFTDEWYAKRSGLLSGYDQGQ